MSCAEKSLGKSIGKSTGRRSMTLWCIALVVMAWTGFQLIFSTFAEYDDEGYVMMSLVRFLAGDELYDKTYTQYGPAYFGLHGILHRVFGIEVSHDVVRIKTLAQWLATAVLCSWSVHRLTGNDWVALAVMVGAFFHLDKLCLEPGHPQEICGLATAGLLLLATYLPDRRRQDAHSKRLSFVIASGMGMLVGVLATTKINVGALGGLAAGSVLGWRFCAAWTGKLGGRLAGAIAAICCLAPWLLTKPSLAAPGAWRLPLWSSCGIAATAIALCGVQRTRRDTNASRDLFPWVEFWSVILFVGSLVATAGVAIGWGLATGTSLAGMYYGLIGQHRAFTLAFFHPAPLPIWTAAVAIAGIAAALHIARATGAGARKLRTRLPWLAGGVAVLAVGLATLGAIQATFQPLQHGLRERGMLLTWVAMLGPLVWLPLFSRYFSDSKSDAESDAESDGECRGLDARALLAVTATLFPMAGYPTPGTQLDVGTFPLLLAAWIGLANLWDQLAEPARAQAGSSGTIRSMGAHRLGPGTSASAGAIGLRESARAKTPMLRATRASLRLAIQTGVVVTCLVLFARASVFAQGRHQATPLGLPGATLLRLDSTRVQHKRWLVEQLRTHCDTFVFAQHGLNHLYFWSQLAPPTSINPTFWPLLLSDVQQQHIVNALGDYSRVGILDLDYGAELPQELPLSRYVAREGSVVAHGQGLRLRVVSQSRRAP
ncbi:MAG: hypothetical protein KDB14_08395 [Planctomycetales bacterium]|nr:hypothetical protein [Planctomycetales bacterium]